MNNRHRILFSFVTIAALGVWADDKLCPDTVSTEPGTSVTTPAAPDASADNTPCHKKDDVGVVSWLLGSHRMPSMHFIDFVELFWR